MNERRPLVSAVVVAHGADPWLERAVRTSLASEGVEAEVVLVDNGCPADVFDGLERYYRFLQAVASDGVAAGWTPLEAAQRADLGEFASWGETERLAANLHRAYSEERGEPLGTPLDMMAAVGDMIAFNGGPPHCLA